MVNVASHCNSTGKGYHQLNELAVQYPELVIIACPCNQFGHQENLVGEEILLSLKHVRPGKGFEPKFPLTEKIEVNGSNAHPLFNFLKISLPYSSDRTLLDEMSAPSGVFSHPMRIIWMPVSRADISWNFEKVSLLVFLCGSDAEPVSITCGSFSLDLTACLSSATAPSATPRSSRTTSPCCRKWTWARRRSCRHVGTFDGVQIGKIIKSRILIN